MKKIILALVACLSLFGINADMSPEHAGRRHPNESERKNWTSFRNQRGQHGKHKSHRHHQDSGNSQEERAEKEDGYSESSESLKN